MRRRAAVKTQYATVIAVAILLKGLFALPIAPASAVELQEGAQNVGILLFNDLFITEFVAPFDIYKHVGKKMNVFTVSQTQDAIRTYEGVRLQADFTFANAPRIDVLVVPSGNGSLTTDLKNVELIDFVRKTASSAQYVTSHCWGAFTLAAAGLLDGREATTFPSAIGKLQRRFPQVKTVKNKRFVEDGNVITSNGGLAAFESALFIVEKLYGTKKAEEVASGLVFAPENRRLSINPVTAMQ
jgi:transcriptional regulator GlxA family with amidase domain